MTAVARREATTTATDDRSASARRPGWSSRLLDDRWPDRFAAAMLFFSGFVLLITFVPPWRRYFAHQYDVVSMVIIPVVPGFV